MAEREQNEKQNLVDAILMLERAGIIDFNGHVSSRAGAGQMRINSGNSSRSALTAADIVTIDFDGRLVEGNMPPPMEFHIHAEIYRRRSDVQAVAHTHPKWSTVLSIAGQKIHPVIMQAAVLGEIKIFPKIASINSRALAAEMADALGDARLITLQSHGAVMVGENVTEAFIHAVYLEETAERQYLAAQLGPLVTLTPEEIAVIGKNLRKPQLFQKVWDYHKGKLRR
jgi:ribulose-5-phosphate 4-epimerase/fuculose-1-phosphate aldolase